MQFFFTRITYFVYKKSVIVKGIQNGSKIKSHECLKIYFLSHHGAFGLLQQYSNTIHLYRQIIDGTSLIERCNGKKKSKFKMCTEKVSNVKSLVLRKKKLQVSISPWLNKFLYNMEMLQKIQLLLFLLLRILHCILQMLVMLRTTIVTNNICLNIITMVLVYLHTMNIKGICFVIYIQYLCWK